MDEPVEGLFALLGQLAVVDAPASTRLRAGEGLVVGVGHLGGDCRSGGEGQRPETKDQDQDQDDQRFLWRRGLSYPCAASHPSAR